MSAHRLIGLDAAACTACMICVRECPTWCIALESHAEQQAEGRRLRTINVLDDFRIDFALCMHCGTCIDVCPTDALHWSAQGSATGATRASLEHHAGQLGEHSA